MIGIRSILKGMVLVLALGFSLMLAAGVWHGRVQEQQTPSPASDPVDAEMKLRDMEYTELREGRRLWTLKAAEARYFQDGQKTLLSSVKVRFYLDNGEEVLLESNEGLLVAGNKNMELWDSVRAFLPQGYMLVTDRALYDHEQQTLGSPSTITLTGPDVQAEGKAWTYRIPESKALVESGVIGTLLLVPTPTRSLQ